jgi:ABC-type glycerol-3-phosphate transport system permease component
MSELTQSTEASEAQRTFSQRPLSAPQPVPPSKRRGAGVLVGLHAVLIVLAVVSVLPFVWLVCATFKINQDMFAFVFLPYGAPPPATEAALNDLQTRWGRVTLDNYLLLFRTKPFLSWLLNSIVLSCAHTVIVVTLSSLGGFALAKYRFAGKGVLALVMLTTMVIPGQVLLPSNYELMRAFGWLNTYWAILVPGGVSVFGMFLFMQAMKGVPDELLQCGRIDGCSELRLWWEIALPIVRPMIGAFTLLSFMGSWNSFLWPQIVLQSPDKYTLPVGLSSLVGLPGDDTPYGMLMAGTLLSVLPVIALFFVLQRDFIAGLTSGAVKG